MKLKRCVYTGTFTVEDNALFLISSSLSFSMACCNLLSLGLDTDCEGHCLSCTVSPSLSVVTRFRNGSNLLWEFDRSKFKRKILLRQFLWLPNIELLFDTRLSSNSFRSFGGRFLFLMI